MLRRYLLTVIGFASSVFCMINNIAVIILIQGSLHVYENFCRIHNSKNKEVIIVNPTDTYLALRQCQVLLCMLSWYSLSRSS